MAEVRRRARLARNHGVKQMRSRSKALVGITLVLSSVTVILLGLAYWLEGYLLQVPDDVLEREEALSTQAWDVTLVVQQGRSSQRIRLSPSESAIMKTAFELGRDNQTYDRFSFNLKEIGVEITHEGSGGKSPFLIGVGRTRSSVMFFVDGDERWVSGKFVWLNVLSYSFAARFAASNESLAHMKDSWARLALQAIRLGRKEVPLSKDLQQPIDEIEREMQKLSEGGRSQG